MKLFLQAMIKFILGVAIVGALIFASAGSFEYWNGWLFMGLLFIPMFIAGLFMMFKNPELLKSRLNGKEKEGEQKKVIALSALMFAAGFIVAGLNYRFKWMEIHTSSVVLSSIVFVASYFLYAEVLRENTYLSRTIEVKKDQKVIDTGLYGIVRHPMYTATILLFLSMPLILGSFISFVIFLIYPVLIAKRIKNEEEVLEKELKGYKKYKKNVKYKLIPYIY